MWVACTSFKHLGNRYIYGSMHGVCACDRACERTCERACVRASEGACERVRYCVRVHARACMHAFERGRLNTRCGVAFICMLARHTFQSHSSS